MLRTMPATILAALLPAALLAAPAAAAPAAAAPAQTGVVVAFADLDLARSEHQAELALRIERAAETACERPFMRDLKAMLAFEQCVTDARDLAQRELANREAPASAVLAAR
jgi:UrcA family protein